MASSQPSSSAKAFSAAPRPPRRRPPRLPRLPRALPPRAHLLRAAAVPWRAARARSAVSTLASRRACWRRSTLKVPLACSGLCDDHQLQRPAHLRRASLLGLRRAPSSLGRRRKAAAALCCPPKAPIPFPLTTQAPWRSGRSGGSKDQAATARDLRRACKALGLRVTSARETPVGTAARSKCPLFTAHATTAGHSNSRPRDYPPLQRSSRFLRLSSGPARASEAGWAAPLAPAQSRRVFDYPGPVVTAETADGDLLEFLAGSAQVDFRVRAAKGGLFGSDGGSVARQHGQIRGPGQWPSSGLTPGRAWQL